MVEVLRKGIWKEKIKGGEKEKEACVWALKATNMEDGQRIQCRSALRESSA